MQIFDFPETIFWQIFEKFKKSFHVSLQARNQGGHLGHLPPRNFQNIA